MTLTLAAQRRQTLTRCVNWWHLNWSMPYLYSVAWYGPPEGSLQVIVLVPWGLN